MGSSYLWVVPPCERSAMWVLLISRISFHDNYAQYVVYFDKLWVLRTQNAGWNIIFLVPTPFIIFLDVSPYRLITSFLPSTSRLPAP